MSGSPTCALCGLGGGIREELRLENGLVQAYWIHVTCLKIAVDHYVACVNRVDLGRR